MTHEVKTTANRSSILIAALLFLLGERSDTIGSAILYLFSCLFEDCVISEFAKYEFSLVALAFGTCFAIVLSRSMKDRNNADDWTIAIGIMTATLAASLNIVDAWLSSELADEKDSLRRTAYFLALWIIVIVAPTLLAYKDKQTILGTGVIASMLALAVALLISSPVRFLSTWFLALSFGGTTWELAKDAYDKVIFRTDTLQVLGTIWVIIAFLKRKLFWKFIYVVLAIAVAICYPLIFDKIDTSMLRMYLLGFGLITICTISPMWSAIDQIWECDKSAIIFCSAICFFLSFIATYLTHADFVSKNIFQKTSLSFVQAVASTLVPINVAITGHLYRKLIPSRRIV